jgi:hypothetical protein
VKELLKFMLQRLLDQTYHYPRARKRRLVTRGYAHRRRVVVDGARVRAIVTLVLVLEAHPRLTAAEVVMVMVMMVPVVLVKTAKAGSVGALAVVPVVTQVVLVS